MGSFTNAKVTGSGTGQTFTSVTGARATSNTGSSAAIREVQQAMIEFEPYQTPILTKLMSSKLGKKPTGNQKFEWINSSLLPMTDTITLAGGSASEDTCTVGDYTLWQIGTKAVVDNTGEVIICDTASTTINVTKVGSGNITAGTTVTVHFMGNSFEQGTSSATAKSVNKNFPYNYVEIFKHAVHETESQQATVEYGPVDWDRNKAARMREFKMHIERNLLHGIRTSAATGYQTGSFTQYFTGGFYDSTAAYISTTYAYNGTAPDEAWFFGTFLRGLFAKGTNKKRLYAGALLVQAINDFSKVKQKTQVTESEYGVDINKVICPFGTLEVVWHPMLDGAVFSMNGIALDFGMGDVIKYRYLSGNGKNRDLQFRDYNDYFKQADSRKGEWLGEIGLQIDGDEYHGLIQPA
jgi:hypothetical protein